MVHQVMITTVGVKLFATYTHTHTLAAGLDVKLARLKPAG